MVTQLDSKMGWYSLPTSHCKVPVVCNGSYIIPEMIFLGGSEYRFIFLLKWYLVMRNVFLLEFSWLLVTSPCSSLALRLRLHLWRWKMPLPWLGNLSVISCLCWGAILTEHSGLALCRSHHTQDEARVGRRLLKMICLKWRVGIKYVCRYRSCKNKYFHWQKFLGLIRGAWSPITQCVL